jgi:actin cytoskeleton-regulatory complex protein SLA1
VDGDGDTGGGLFSGPGGTLRNNTRKGRPAPAVQTNDVIDAKAFSQSKESSPDSKSEAPANSNGNNATRRSEAAGSSSGFDDDAWNVKPLKQQTPEPTAARAPEPAPAPNPAAAPRPVQQPLSQNMQELSLLSQPLQPTKVETPAIQPPPVAPQAALLQAPATAPPVAAIAPPQPTGATPGFFTALAQQQTGLPQQMAINGQQTGIARQRPIPPQFTSGQGALVPPPPSRPLSAPQSAQPSAFAPPPLQPQMTGIPYPTQQIAPPGQSLNEISQARMQQQYLQMQQQQMAQQQQLQSPPMAFGPQPTGMVSFPTGLQPQPTGFMSGQFGQPMMQNGGVPMQSPFADPIRPQQFSPVQAQPTGFPGQFGPQQGFGGPPGAAGGLNNYLPPALEPQRTAAPIMPQMSSIPPMPPMPTGFAQQQPPIAPLQPQKTGPPPPVRFGVTPEAQKLMAQPTGRRANLASASELCPP